MTKAGQRVKFARLPNWVADLPDESQRVFAFCLGCVYTIEEIESHGLLVLDVSQDIDSRFGGYMNDIRVEAEFVEEEFAPE